MLCVVMLKQQGLAKHVVRHWWYSHDGLSLCARAEVSLDLGLVDSVQSQHQEDSSHTQRPEGVALQRVGVQATQAENEYNMNIWIFQKAKKIVFLSKILCSYLDALQHVKVTRNTSFYCTSNMPTTHSSPAMRLPLTAFLHTSAMPPAWLAPTTMTASWPANITTVWNTSVQITAFRPPWDRETVDSL